MFLAPAPRNSPTSPISQATVGVQAPFATRPGFMRATRFQKTRTPNSLSFAER